MNEPGEGPPRPGVRLNNGVVRLDELAKRLSNLSETLAGQGPEPAPDDRNRAVSLVSPPRGLIEASAHDLSRIAAAMAFDIERIERLLP